MRTTPRTAALTLLAGLMILGGTRRLAAQTTEQEVQRLRAELAEQSRLAAKSAARLEQLERELKLRAEEGKAMRQEYQDRFEKARAVLTEQVKKELDSNKAELKEMRDKLTEARDKNLAAEIDMVVLKKQNGRLEIQLQQLAKDNARLRAALEGKTPVAPKDPERNSPPGNVEGRVLAVAADGLMTLNAGADAGLQKGHTLELFRLAPQPQYLGMVVIVEVRARESVAKPVGKMTAPPKEGDNVASRLGGN